MGGVAERLTLTLIGTRMLDGSSPVTHPRRREIDGAFSSRASRRGDPSRGGEDLPGGEGNEASDT